MLEQQIGKPFDTATLDDLHSLKEILNAIEDGACKPDEFFISPTTEINEALKAKDK
jgi:hypothetical protein